MKKNVAGQFIGAQLVSATDGSAFTGSVTVYVTGDAGTQAVGSVGSGACTHEGNGYHTYAPAQAETNYGLIAFTFIGTGAVPATVQVFTSFPQTVDNATDIAAIKVKTDYLPSATAGAAGGVFIAGTNAPVTITGSGNALTLLSTGANGSGLAVTGNGTGDGLIATSGSGATGAGIYAVAASTVGQGFAALGSGTGDGIYARSGQGATGNGMDIRAISTNGYGFRVQGAGANAALYAQGGTTGHGAQIWSGSGGGNGMLIEGDGTFPGIRISGGLTSGNGIDIVTTDGHGIEIAPGGTSKHGILTTGASLGTSDGLKAVAGAAGGVPIRGDITGNITGNLSGSVNSVTTDVGITAAAVDAVWDEAIAGHLGAGSTGEALNAAGAAGDPWVTALPGAYGAGSAGYIVGTNLDAQVSTAGGGLDAAGVRAAVGLASANLDTQLAALPTADENADAVWDEVLTGATHNVATSAGRRLRGVQDNAAYDDGSIWVDTVNGTSGTTVYENGTSGLPVLTIGDALTLASAANLKHLHIVNGSTITLAATMDNFELSGDEWGLAFGGQSANGLSVHSAHLSGVGVSGTFSGNPHILHSAVGAITGPNARIGWCAITNTITSNGVGTWVIHSCWGLSGAGFDFGAGGAQVVYITDWVGGPITISSMAAGDILYVEGRSAALTLAASCTGGTVYLAGDIALINSGSGQTINQTSRFELTRIISDSAAFQGADIAAIKAVTDALPDAGALTSLATAAALTTVDGIVDTILLDTDELQTNQGNWLTATGFATSAALVTAQADLDDLQTRIPAALTAGGNMKADVLAISSSTESADRLERSTLAIVTGTVTTGATTTSIPTSAISPTGTDADQFKGRIIIFDKDTTTAALRGQATDITANTAAANPTFTVTALTTAPANTDTFTIT